jgi:poly(3-hydroxybutyrate) depolymerase
VHSSARPRSPVFIAIAVALALAACGGGSPGQSSALPQAPGGTPVVQPSPSAQPSPVVQLQSYQVNPSQVFVAGISSGGFFGVQMHVAHSQTFKGAAIYAGGVYYCAMDSVATALAACGGEDSYQSTLTESEAYLDLNSNQGTIDPESNLRGQPVYLWSGTQDTVVPHQEMNDLETEYTHYGANVKYDNDFPAEHGWESPNGQLACGTAATPYMITCDLGSTPYDSEKTWLSLFLGTLKPRNDGTLSGSLIHIDQTAFGASASNSMDTNGYLFVPKDCAAGKTCALIVAFHGCLQTQALIGTDFITEGGIDQWADTNDILVLYPYAIASTTVPYNPNGCWDWWGYDDPNYALQSGTQISIVYKMVQRIMGSAL